MLFTEKWVINELTRIVKSYPQSVNISPEYTPEYQFCEDPAILLNYIKKAP